jgi:HD superfamily phosphohydrolase
MVLGAVLERCRSTGSADDAALVYAGPMATIANSSQLAASVDAVLASRPIRRLRRVSQAGAPSLMRGSRRVSRFEHSVGVAQLLACAGGSEAEVLAGLLHDVGHFAFSHTADYLLGNRAEDSHEEFSVELARPLLERHAPTLAREVLATIASPPAWLRLADALDYTTRDLRGAGLLDANISDNLTRSVGFFDGDLVFEDSESAIAFVNLMWLANGLYRDPVDMYRHWSLSNVLRDALERGEIEPFDLCLTDHDLLALVLKCARSRDQLIEYVFAPARLLGQPAGAKAMHARPRLREPQVRVSSSRAEPLSMLWPDWQAQQTRAERLAECPVPGLRLS